MAWYSWNIWLILLFQTYLLTTLSPSFRKFFSSTKKRRRRGVLNSWNRLYFFIYYWQTCFISASINRDGCIQYGAQNKFFFKNFLRTYEQPRKEGRCWGESRVSERGYSEPCLTSKMEWSFFAKIVNSYRICLIFFFKKKVV